MAYFIRRSGDNCAGIQLHPDDREEVIASGLAPGEAEDLCAARIEEKRRSRWLINDLHIWAFAHIRGNCRPHSAITHIGQPIVDYDDTDDAFRWSVH